MIGLIFLVASANWFVEGSAVAARYLGMPPLLIGIIIVGFGTSAPELLVSAMSAVTGTPGIGLGNAYGSNICNIALILGLTAMICPIDVASGILKKQLPILTGITAVAAVQLSDGQVTRTEAGILLIVFSGIIAWSLVENRKPHSDTFESAIENHVERPPKFPVKDIVKLTGGLIVLILSANLLVQGAVGIATLLGISDLVIGLTIIAVGTSLPELASSTAAALKKEHDIALGNIIGSNIFNTLTVVGVSGVIRPLNVDSAILFRDLPFMAALTVSLFIVGFGFRGRPGRINRWEGAGLLISYVAYVWWLIFGLTPS